MSDEPQPLRLKPRPPPPAGPAAEPETGTLQPAPAPGAGQGEGIGRLRLKARLNLPDAALTQAVPDIAVAEPPVPPPAPPSGGFPLPEPVAAADPESEDLPKFKLRPKITVAQYPPQEYKGAPPPPLPPSASPSSLAAAALPPPPAALIRLSPAPAPSRERGGRPALSHSLPSFAVHAADVDPGRPATSAPGIGCGTSGASGIDAASFTFNGARPVGIQRHPCPGNGRPAEGGRQTGGCEAGEDGGGLAKTARAWAVGKGGPHRCRDRHRGGRLLQLQDILPRPVSGHEDQAAGDRQAGGALQYEAAGRPAQGRVAGRACRKRPGAGKGGRGDARSGADADSKPGGQRR